MNIFDRSLGIYSLRGKIGEREICFARQQEFVAINAFWLHADGCIRKYSCLKSWQSETQSTHADQK